MKTKELKKIVKENGYEFEEGLISVFIKNDGELVMKMSSDGTVSLGQNYFLFSNRIKTVMKALIEYSETPIEEREEEKKYYLKTHLRNYRDDEFLYLHKHTFSDNLWLIESSYTSFTQSEIDNFSPEIKGTIECGFLKKVEVEK